MRFFGFGKKQEPEEKEFTINDVLRRIALLQNTASGERITEETALNSPTFFAAVTGISRTIAQLPIDVVRNNPDGTRTKEKDHNLYKLLTIRPNEWQSRFEYWQQVGINLLMHNVFYAYKNQAPNGRIINLHPLHPSNVEPLQTSDMKVEYRVTFSSGEQKVLDSKKIHRVMLMSTDGISPVSPLKKLAESIGLEIAAEKYGAALFENGAIPNIVLKRPGKFKDKETFERFRDSWNEGFRKKGGTAILEEGFDVEKMQMSAEESQFLETRKLQRAVIAGAMNLSPHRVGDLSRATFNNVEQLSMEYVSYSVMPLLVAIETAATRDLVPPNEVGKLFVKFNVRGLLRSDSKGMAESLKIRREWGIINANEWRELDDMNPISDEDGGNDYLRPLNYTAGNEDPDQEVDPPKSTRAPDEDLDNLEE